MLIVNVDRFNTYSGRFGRCWNSSFDMVDNLVFGKRLLITELFYLAAMWQVFCEVGSIVTYYQLKRLRRKYLGKTALFYMHEINPRVRKYDVNGEAGCIIPIWRLNRINLKEALLVRSHTP